MDIPKQIVYTLLVALLISFCVNVATFVPTFFDKQKDKKVIVEKVNSEDTFYLNKNYDNAVHPIPYCRFGLQFLIVLPNDNYLKSDSSIVQVFDVDPKTGMSVPMKCKDFALTKPESKKHDNFK